MNAESQFRAALYRLVTDKPEIIEKGFSINQDTVALEAGKKRGALQRRRFPKLCEEVAAAEKERLSKIYSGRTSGGREKNKDLERLKNDYREKYRGLQKEYSLCLEKVVNLLYENHQLKRQLEFANKSNVNVVEISNASDEQ